MTNFHVGQKVVCVDSKTAPPPISVAWEYRSHWTPPTERDVYTIAATGFSFDYDEPIVYLVELKNTGVDGRDVGYLSRRFRPVRATNIDVFLKMLEPQPQDDLVTES